MSRRAGMILVNEKSGPSGAVADEIAAAFPGERTERFEPETYKKYVDDAVAVGARFVGVAGGDGTIRCVAQELLGTPTALLAVPAGTRNHFARTLGIDSFERAAEALDAESTPVDVGEIDGRCFVNNASIGLYPEMVERREAHERALPKPLAQMVAAWQQLWRGRKIVVTIGAESMKSWMVFVGNGCYGDNVRDLGHRATLTDNVLDVRVVRADRRGARVRVLGALLFGRLERSPLIERFASAEVTIHMRSARADVAVDGEVEKFATPLHFRSRPLALRVLVPPHFAD